MIRFNDAWEHGCDDPHANIKPVGGATVRYRPNWQHPVWGPIWAKMRHAWYPGMTPAVEDIIGGATAYPHAPLSINSLRMGPKGKGPALYQPSITNGEGLRTTKLLDLTFDTQNLAIIYDAWSTNTDTTATGELSCSWMEGGATPDVKGEWAIRSRDDGTSNPDGLLMQVRTNASTTTAVTRINDKWLVDSPRLEAIANLSTSNHNFAFFQNRAYLGSAVDTNVQANNFGPNEFNVWGNDTASDFMGYAFSVMVMNYAGISQNDRDLLWLMDHMYEGLIADYGDDNDPYTYSSGGAVSVNVTGVSGTGSVGSVTVTAKANTSVTGVAGTSAVGSATVAADANTSVTGVAGTSAIGSSTVTADANVSPTSDAATASVGSVTVSTAADVNVSVTGVEGTGAVGSATVTAAANTDVTGLSSTASVGSVTVTADANASVTGLAGTSAIGSVTETGYANVSVTGVAGTSAVGSATVSEGLTNAPVTGVSATGYVGLVLVWSRTVETQSPNFSNVDDSQTANWTPVDDSQTDGWNEVA